MLALLCVLAACTDPPLLDDTGAPPLRLASPGALTPRADPRPRLVVPPLTAGQPATLQVVGASPLTPVDVWMGGLGDLRTPPATCPAGTPVCLDLDGATLLVSGTTDANGDATLTWSPVDEPIDSYPVLQALAGANTSVRVMRRVHLDAAYPTPAIDPFDPDYDPIIAEGDYYDLWGDYLDNYRIPAGAGQVVTVVMRPHDPASTSDLRETLRAPDPGDPVGSVFPPEGGRRWIHSVNWGGFYQLTLENYYSWEPDWGVYDLRVRLDERQQVRWWYDDLDDDGFGDPASGVLGTSGGLQAVANQGDCDDDDASIQPGAYDACGDGVDQDCDGVARACEEGSWQGIHHVASVDVAALAIDNYLYAAAARTDGPGALPEAWLPVDFELMKITADLRGVLAFDPFSDGVCCYDWIDLVPVPDLDGDGHEGLFVPDYDASIAHFVDGPIQPGDLPSQAVTTVHAPPDSKLRTVVTGHFDSDGVLDFAFGAKEISTIYVVSGPLPPGDVDLPSAAVATLVGPLRKETGSDLGATDLDGDGLDDLWILNDAPGGFVAVAPFSGTIDLLSEAHARLLEAEFLATADTDGDGIDELLYTQAEDDIDGDGALDDAVLHFATLPAGAVHGSDATGRWHQSHCTTVALRAVAADVDGDGRDEVLVVDPCHGSPGVRVFDGAPSGDRPLHTSRGFYVVDAGNWTSLTSVGDLDDDGDDEVLVDGHLILGGPWR